MKNLKKLLRYVVTRAYRFAAPETHALFNLPDIYDPFFGEMTGVPVDRVLIENYLKSRIEKSYGIPKTSLEVGSVVYLEKYWPTTAKYLLEFRSGLPLTRKKNNVIEGDFCFGSDLEDLKFDVICLAQVLPYLKNLEESLSTLSKISSNGGLIIGSVPFLTPISVFDDSRWGEIHRFTKKSLTYLLQSTFPSKTIEVMPLGNALTSAAIILGIPSDKFHQIFLNLVDLVMRHYWVSP